MVKKPPRKRSAKKRSEGESIPSGAARFRVPGDARCDACGATRTHHVPLCAEVDPHLITFWASLCDRCLLKREQGVVAYRKIRARGWARGGTITDIFDRAS